MTDALTHAHTIGQEHAASFNTDGVVVIRNLFNDWIDLLRQGVDENMAKPGPHVRHYTPKGGSGNFFGDYCNWQRIEPYRQFVTESPAAALVAGLTDSKHVRFFHEHVLVKEPGTEEPTPWHHDQPYYNVDGKKNCSLWIPLDPVADTVCPEFIQGSHSWDRWFRPRKFTGQDWDRDMANDGLEDIPDFEAQRDQHTISSWNLQPGDALAFHFLTVHGAPANPSSTRRRGFSARFVGDDARWAKRSGPTSPPFPELQDEMTVGQPLDHSHFPKVWPVS